MLAGGIFGLIWFWVDGQAGPCMGGVTWVLHGDARQAGPYMGIYLGITTKRARPNEEAGTGPLPSTSSGVRTPGLNLINKKILRILTKFSDF